MESFRLDLIATLRSSGRGWLGRLHRRAGAALVIGEHPGIVVLEFGANDGLRGLPVAGTEANLRRMVAGLQEGGAKVVLAGMTLPPNYGAEYILQFEEMVETSGIAGIVKHGLTQEVRCRHEQ